MFSAVHPITDITKLERHVRKVPPPDSCTGAKYRSFRLLESEVLQDFFSPALPTQQFCRAELRPSCNGGGGKSQESIAQPDAALRCLRTAAGHQACQPPGHIEAPRAAAAPHASPRPSVTGLA